MGQIQSGFIRAVEEYIDFRSNREKTYIDHINSNIKKLEDFIDSNKDAIIEGIAATKILEKFYLKYDDDTDNKTERISLNSDYDIYSFDIDKFIIGDNCTSIKVVCDLDPIDNTLCKSYYMNIRYDDPIRVNTNFDTLSSDTLSEYNKCFENFTVNLFSKLKRTNFVSIENDLLIKLEQFKDIITNLKN